MTVVKRRPKTPAPPEPWPSQAEPEGRVTTEGKVSSLPSPVQAMWAEAIGRSGLGQYDSQMHEAEGLCVAIAILSCQPLEDVRAELRQRARRANMSVFDS